MQIEKQVCNFPVKNKHLVVPFFLNKKVKKHLIEKYNFTSITCIIGLKILLIRVIRSLIFKLKMKCPYVFLRPFKFSKIRKKNFYKEVRDKECDILLCEYIWYADLLEYVHKDENILTVIETHDIQHNFANYFKSNHKGCAKFDVKLQDELNILNKFDIVLAISRKDEEFFNNNLSTKVVYLPSVLTKDIKMGDKKLAGFSIGFIGSDAPFNVDAVNWLLNKVIKNKLISIPKEIRFNIYGKVCKCFNEATLPENVILNGLKDDLSTVYKENVIMVNPTYQSGGIKTKNLEALLYCTPVITTTIGTYGMESAIQEGCVFVADDEYEFAKIVNNIFKNPSIIHGVESKCKRYMDNNFSYKIYEEYIDIITDVQK